MPSSFNEEHSFCTKSSRKQGGRTLPPILGRERRGRGWGATRTLSRATCEKLNSKQITDLAVKRAAINLLCKNQEEVFLSLGQTSSGTGVSFALVLKQMTMNSGLRQYELLCFLGQKSRMGVAGLKPGLGRADACLAHGEPLPPQPSFAGPWLAAAPPLQGQR